MTEPGTTALSLPEDDGLLFACRLDGAGGAALVGWAQLEADARLDDGTWVHLDRTSARARTWLLEREGLSTTSVDALLSEESRPRVFRIGKGTIAILRGVNLHPDAEPEDLVTIRIWTDGKRLISVRHRRLLTPRDVLQQLIENGDGPRDASELFERLVSRLIERMSATILAFDERLDDIEEALDTAQPADNRRDISELRRHVVALRRYLAPQREALTALLLEPPAWLGDRSRFALRETDNRMLRYVEELDAARERAIVIKDDIANRLAERTNHTLYLLSIVSAVFLPLTFVTGLLGMNVGGLPGEKSSLGFWVTTLAMLGIALFELLLLRRIGWLGRNAGKKPDDRSS